MTKKILEIRKPRSTDQNTCPFSLGKMRVVPLFEPLQIARDKRKIARQLKDAFEKFIAKETEFSPTYATDRKVKFRPCYSEAEEAIKGIGYSAKDVENFSLSVSIIRGESCFSHHLGLFLSALINHGRDSDYIIHTRHFKGNPPDCLGLLNTKNILVKGKAGMWLGEFMKDGSIVCTGSAYGGVANGMDGGSILVKGKVGEGSAQYMRGGTLTIKKGINERFYDYHGFGAFSEEIATVYIKGGNLPGVRVLSELKLYYKGKIVPNDTY